MVQSREWMRGWDSSEFPDGYFRPNGFRSSLPDIICQYGWDSRPLNLNNHPLTINNKPLV